MLFHFRNEFPRLNAYWDRYLPYQERKEIPARTVLLAEGKVSTQYIFVEKGCLMASFNNNGEDRAVQFFFENEGLTSFESFVNNTPSYCTIRTIEPCILYFLPKNHVMQLFDELASEADFLQFMLKISSRRQVHYINEFVSFIRDTGEERYLRLLSERPHIVQRIPQHYIASYLGMSPVHLSRVKNKILKGKPHF